MDKQEIIDRIDKASEAISQRLWHEVNFLNNSSSNNLQENTFDAFKVVIDSFEGVLSLIREIIVQE